VYESKTSLLGICVHINIHTVNRGVSMDFIPENVNIKLAQYAYYLFQAYIYICFKTVCVNLMYWYYIFLCIDVSLWMATYH
jgi:hypothetical protein